MDWLVACTCSANVVYELSGFFPAEAGVGDGAAVDVAADFLAAGLDIAFDHDALYQAPDIHGVVSAVKNLLHDPDLLLILLVGVGVIRINNTCRILQITLTVHITEETKILIMVVRLALTVLVHCTAEDCVSVRIAIRVNLPAAENEGMTMLRGHDGVQHNRIITTGGILHAGADIHTADSQTVLLIFHRTGTDCHIGEQIGKIAVVLRIKHFIGSGKAGFF